MIVTVVFFRAFDHNHVESFIDKTPGEIHYALLKTCDTYITISITAFNEGIIQPASLLDNFPRPEKRKIILNHPPHKV